MLHELFINHCTNCTLIMNPLTYFSQMTIKEIVKGHSYFRLHFGETVTAQVKKTKQMNLNVLVRSGQWGEN